MLLRETTYHTCPTCKQHKCVDQEEAYGCDACGKEIDMSKKGVEYIDATAHHHNEAAKHFQYCSWKCCLKHLRNIKTDYFISLPLLSFDSNQKGLRAKDFFALMKK